MIYNQFKYFGSGFWGSIILNSLYISIKYRFCSDTLIVYILVILTSMLTFWAHR